MIYICSKKLTVAKNTPKQSKPVIVRMAVIMIFNF